MKTKIYVEVKAINLKDRQVLKFTLITFFFKLSFFKKKLSVCSQRFNVLKGSMCCWNDALQQQVQVQCKAAIMACLCGE